MGRARVKKGGGSARFPLWEENPRELWVRIIRGLSVGIITENYGTRAYKKGRGTRTVHSLREKSSGIIFWELWPSKTWHDAEKLRFIGILAYPKRASKKRGYALVRGILRGIRISRLTKIPTLLLWLTEILELRKGLIIKDAS